VLRFIHLTDCHLLNQNTKSLRHINTYESLNKVIQDIKHKQFEYDFLLITGDISQDGSKESYETFSTLVKALNKPIYCLPGNHDDPVLLKNSFQQSPNQAISVNQIQNHLLILLNSQIEGLESGKISKSQLQQLNNLLKTNLNRPVIIALHHQPVIINSAWMDDIGLINGEELLTLMGNFPTVKMMLFGHIHQEVNTNHRHIKIMGTPSTCYQFKPHKKTIMVDQLGPAYRIIKLLNNRIETEVCRINK